MVLKQCTKFSFSRGIAVCAFACVAFAGWGCAPKLSSPHELQEFQRAGPIKSETDFSGAVGVKNYIGPYRVVTGDILEFQMPTLLRVMSADLPEWLRPVAGRKDFESYLTRVNRDGMITLPIIGEIHVAGKTLAEVEAVIIDAYYPKYVVEPPMVVCEVKKYQNESQRVFAVLGLVNHAGVFPYPADVHYNLMEALAFAGGLDMVADPRYLNIYRQDTSGKIASVVLGIDKGALSDACTLTIKPGDLIYVDHTLRTRANKFVSDVFYISIGADTRYTPH